MCIPKVNLKLEFIYPEFLTSSQANYKIKNSAAQGSVYPGVRQIAINKLTLLVHGEHCTLALIHQLWDNSIAIEKP